MIKRLKRVYIAGAYSADNVIDVLRNIREGIKLGERVFATGLAAPFVPWFDWQFEMMGDHSVSLYYEYSMAWLEVSDAVLVRKEGSSESKGTQAEIARADELGIPVFYDYQWEGFYKWLTR